MPSSGQQAQVQCCLISLLLFSILNILGDIFPFEAVGNHFLRKPCQMVSSFRSLLADNSQDYALYSSLLRTQALIRLGIFILLSVRTYFNSFHFWMKCGMLDNGKDLRRCR